MNRDQIIQMAREAGIVLTCDIQDGYIRDGRYASQLERFAAIVAAAEREACEQIALDPDHLAPHWPQVTVPQSIAAAIRARGEKN